MMIEQWGIEQWREVLRMLAFRRLMLEQYPDPALDDPKEAVILKGMWKDVQVKLHELSSESSEN